MRVFGGIILLAVFLTWVMYRLFIKKDLKQNLTALYVYSSFIGVWLTIYVCMINL
jgi:CRISPR/Cas system endoribonuclease Cas6 (RAMP superfamily)